MKSAEQLAEEKYPETSDNRIRRAISSEKRKAFIEGYNADRWIPVEEELPEERLVLVIGNRGFSPSNIQVCEYDKKYGFTSTSGVTHWQPLPSPPKQNNQV